MPATRTHYTLHGPARRRVPLARVLLTAAARAQQPVTVAFTGVEDQQRRVRTLEIFDTTTSRAGHTLFIGMCHWSPARGAGCVTAVRADRIRWIRLHQPGYRLDHPWPFTIT